MQRKMEVAATETTVEDEVGLFKTAVKANEGRLGEKGRRRATDLCKKIEKYHRRYKHRDEDLIEILKNTRLIIQNPNSEPSATLIQIEKMQKKLIREWGIYSLESQKAIMEFVRILLIAVLLMSALLAIVFSLHAQAAPIARNITYAATGICAISLFGSQMIINRNRKKITAFKDRELDVFKEHYHQEEDIHREPPLETETKTSTEGKRSKTVYIKI